MSDTVTFDEIEFELPARPGVLAELSAELEAADPDFRKVSVLVNNDLGLAAAVVRTANSPYFGVSGRIGSVQHAINFLGLSQVFSLVSGAMLRGAFPENDPLMDELWDISTKRAALMARLARNTPIPPDRAYTVGLFQDCGVAMLAARVSDYRQTWQRTRWLPDAPQTERSEHVTDHPTLGALLVQHWRLPAEIAQAVRFHHEIDKLAALDVFAPTRSLVALSVLANLVLVQALAQDVAPWEAQLHQAAALLHVSSPIAQTWVEQASSLL